MQTLAEQFYLDMVIAAMVLFVVVLGFVSITDRDPRTPD